MEVVKTDEPLIESRAERDIGRGVELMFGVVEQIVVAQIVVAQIMDEKHHFARMRHQSGFDENLFLAVVVGRASS
jgi:hypothetical protein